MERKDFSQSTQVLLSEGHADKKNLQTAKGFLCPIYLISLSSGALLLWFEIYLMPYEV